MDALSKLGLWAVTSWRFTRYCGARFMRNGGPSTAAALSYSSLLALVPFFAISFALLSAFNAFEEVRVDLQALLFDAMLPDAAKAMSQHLAEFIANANRMTGAGIVALAVTAVLLLNTINGAFSAIWRAREPKPLALRLLIYWSLLTLGPLLLGASITVSTYAFAAVRWSGIEDYARPFVSQSWLLPFGLSAVGFTLLFLVVPNRSVQLKHAVAGALVAAFLFEALKKGFGLYLSHFPSYQAIYGALAAVPIFLVWMYLSWSVLLIGAEIAASLPEWRATEARRHGVQGPGTELALALTLLGRLKRAAAQGDILRESALSRRLPATLEELDAVLGALQRQGYVARAGAGRWVLSRDLAVVTLSDLLRALRLSFEPGEGWPDEVAAAIEAVAQAADKSGQTSLAEILDESTADQPLRLGRLA